jgi:glycosyltransferase involved in cell wall biosynthesis
MRRCVHLLAPGAAARARLRAESLMRDLLVTTHTPVLRSGQAMRTYGVARALATHAGLDLLYVRFGAEQPDAAFRSIPGIELHAVEPSRGMRRLLSYATALLHGVPNGLARGVSPELTQEATRLAEDRGTAEQPRGRVIADGPLAAAALAGLARRRAVIYNAHNFESGFRHELESNRIERVFASVTLRSFERRLLRRASEAWMVSEADMASAQELCPQARLRYVPNVVDVTAIAPVSPLSEEPRAIFVASFLYEPNRNAVRFLLKEVFPRVWQQFPQARLALVGAGLDQSPSADPRVEALGFVDDLGAAYASARCAVVPLLQGGGTPLKLIEALAHGLPVIATSRAAAGLQLRDGEHCLLADDAASFAAALVQVLRDGAPELGRRGRALMQARYSIEALSRLVED